MAVKPVERPKASGKWWIRIRWQLTPTRRFRKSKFIGAGKEGRDAAFLKAKLLNDAWVKFGADAIKLVEPEIPESPRILTVEEYGPGFIARATAAGLKRSTITMYSTTLTHHIYPALGKVELDKINYRVLADFYKAEMKYSTARFRKPLADEKKEKARPKGTERRYSRDSIRIMAMTMRALMAEAVRDQIVQINPVMGLSRFYRKKRKDREVNRSGVYTTDELHRIEDQLAARNPEYYEFSLAMSREGMRIGEAMALTIHDADWARGTKPTCRHGRSRGQRQDGCIASVWKHMGHANAGITLGLYTHFVPKKRRLEGTVLDRNRATIGQPERENEWNAISGRI